jgi:hypothetical protein
MLRVFSRSTTYAPKERKKAPHKGLDISTLAAAALGMGNPLKYNA